MLKLDKKRSRFRKWPRERSARKIIEQRALMRDDQPIEFFP
jgi:hypothetical protein